MSREIDLIGGFYRDEPWSAQDTVNWLPVPAQAEGTRSPMKLRGVPGLRAITPTPDFSILGDYSLLHFDGEITDTGTVPQIWTARQDTNGGTLPLTSSAQSKFGSASASFTASAGSLSVSGFYGSGNLASLISGDFTVEAFVRRTSFAIDHANPIGFFDGSSRTCLLLNSAADTAQMVIGESSSPSVSWAFPRNEWIHCAFQRRGTTWEMFTGGVLRDSRVSAYSFGGSAIARIGLRLTGFVDEHRITFGRAVYPTAGFTPPDQPFQDDPNL